MKRNLDIARLVMLALEEGESKFTMPKIDGRTEEELEYHLELLVDAGLVIRLNGAPVYRLSWQGHEFLDAARPAERWRMAKATIEKIGGVGFAVALELLTDLARKQLGLA